MDGNRRSQKLAAVLPVSEKKVNMNLHVFRTPTDPEHWETQGIWSAAENLADDFHVYGLE